MPTKAQQQAQKSRTNNAILTLDMLAGLSREQQIDVVIQFFTKTPHNLSALDVRETAQIIDRHSDEMERVR